MNDPCYCDSAHAKNACRHRCGFPPIDQNCALPDQQRRMYWNELLMISDDIPLNVLKRWHAEGRKYKNKVEQAADKASNALTNG